MLHLVILASFFVIRSEGRNPVMLGICAWFGDRFRVRHGMTERGCVLVIAHLDLSMTSVR